MPRLSVCIEMYWRDLPYEERIARVARLGFPAFEFWGWKNKDILKIEATMAQVVNEIKDIMGSKVKIVTEEQRLRPSKSEVFRLWCDNTKINKLTGFTPEYNLRQGLEKTIDWFANPKNLKKYKAHIYNV